jgi:ElaA protein
MDVVWHCRSFHELTTVELYAIVSVRERVFVVEQSCLYLDADGIDVQCRHLWGVADTDIAAYCRIVPPGVKYDETSIGRVLVAPEHRGTGLAKQLMQRAIATCGPVPIRIGAQAYLEKFYRDQGFAPASAPYIEVGIAHLEMVRHSGWSGDRRA